VDTTLLIYPQRFCLYLYNFSVTLSADQASVTNMFASQFYYPHIAHAFMYNKKYFRL